LPLAFQGAGLGKVKLDREDRDVPRRHGAGPA
jgi:hypothetical protein